MSDFHHNIFYFYKGSSAAVADRDQQLEDNTTKALINVLENCSALVSRQFLNWIGVETHGAVTCHLQRPTIGKGLIRAKRNRILLGLIPSPRAEELAYTDSTREGETSRPDAWLHGDDFVVLIESKVAGGLDRSQVQRHLKTLSADEAVKPIELTRTWAQVHKFFAALDGDLTPKDEWLVQQFTKYLEWINMSDFVGFEAETFEFFYGRKDVDSDGWFRSNFHLFAASLLQRLKPLDSFYEAFDIGNFKENYDHCWVAFGPAERRYRNFAHQSVSVTSSGIEVFLNVETSDAVKRLRKLMNSRTAFESAVLSLQNIEEIAAIVVERIPIRGPLFQYIPVARVEGRFLLDPRLRSDSFSYITTLLQTIPYPEFTLQIHFDRNDVVAMKEKIVEEVLGVMKNFHPLVTLINS